MGNQKHLTFDKIYEYINAKDITRDNYEMIYEIDCHIAECEECFEKIQFLSDIKQVLNEWTPEIHGQLYRKILEDEEEKEVSKNELKTEWTTRLQNWIEKYSGKADTAVEVFMNTVENGTKLVTEGMEALTKPQPRFSFQGRMATATRSMTSRGLRGRRSAGNSKLEDEGTKSIISINASNKDNQHVYIELKDIDPEKIPLVMLVSQEDESAMPKVKEPEQEGDKWIARFEHIPSGKYILMVEPLD